MVWNAMSSIVLMILLISAEVSSIICMADTICSICALQLSISVLVWFIFLCASSAWAAVSRTCAEISVIVAASSSTELACSVAPWLSTCAPEESCSAPPATPSAAWSICCNVSVISLFSSSMEVNMALKLPTYISLQLLCTVKSPAAMPASWSWISPSMVLKPCTRFCVAPAKIAVSSFARTSGTGDARSPCESSSTRCAHCLIGSPMRLEMRNAIIHATSSASNVSATATPIPR